jgi:hypothetical protein
LLLGGSSGTQQAYAAAQFVRGATGVGFSGQASRTDRFLDPPALENWTNSGSHSSLSARVEHDFSRADRLRVSVWRRGARFLVPNEREQQEAGQRQDRDNAETMAQASWQRVLSPRLVSSTRGMVRQLGTRLWSNSLATPIFAEQDRGFSEGYASSSLALQHGAHELKGGFEGIYVAVRERFAYRIADPAFFDDDVPNSLRFEDRRPGREYAGYVQDLIRAGNLTLNAGVRWDRYSLLVRERHISPRLGAAYHFPGAGLVFRGSYDRAFQTPAVENLLLSSLGALPVPASRGDFYQAGFAKSLFKRMRLDGSWFRRDIRNYADDDLLLNTGVNFPVAFDRASIHGFEARLEVPRWKALSGYLSFSNLVGRGYLPVTGGLFLEEVADELLRSNGSFPISQDQRNTASGRLRFQAHPRLWVALGAWYGSGLPFEDELTSEDLEGRYGRPLLERVNFERGRVRPGWWLDALAGLDLVRNERGSLSLQFDALNLGDRLNVINFAGIFSGTALAPPRTLSLRLSMEF